MSPITLLSAIADYTIKATAIIGIALLIDVVMKRASASLKKRIWLIAIAALLILPVVSGLLPQLNIPVLKPFGYSNINVDNIDPALLANIDNLPTTFWTTDNIAIAFLSIYIAGVIVFIIWQLVGRAYAATIRYRAKPMTREAVKKAVYSSQTTFGFGDKIEVLQGSTIKAPFSTGIFRPAIVFPAGSEEWPEDVIETVVTHEMVHIKRRDLATRSLAQIACSLNWFNPLVWYALRKLHMEQEITCDDYVLNSGMKPSEYAQHLLAIAEIRHGKLSYALAAMGHHGELKDRLLEILKPSRSKSPVRGMTSALFLLVSALLLTPVFLVNLWDINTSVTAEEDSKAKFISQKELPGKDSEKDKVTEVKSKKSTVPRSDLLKKEISKKIEQMKKDGVSEKEINAYLSEAKAKIEMIRQSEIDQEKKNKQAEINKIKKQKEIEKKKEKGKSTSKEKDKSAPAKEEG